jgi:predicted ester cyclase
MSDRVGENVRCHRRIVAQKSKKPKKASLDMANETTKDLVRRYYERVVAGGKHDEILQFIGADYVDHNSPAGAPRGPIAVETHLRGIRNTFPDFAMQIHEVVAEGDWVASRVTATGTHLGSWLGVEPSGKCITLRGINLDRVSDGRIVEHWGEANTLGMLIQMGLDPFKLPTR